jgi:hypothetical protein
LSKIQNNIEALKREITEVCANCGRNPDEITVVYVTKNVEISSIEEAIKAGAEVFGENRVQEAATKWPDLLRKYPQIELHLIGRLQKNKINKTGELFKMIESVDSLELASQLNFRLKEKKDVLLEINTSNESTKGGFAIEEALDAYEEISKMQNLRVLGFMTIGPNTSDEIAIRKSFKLLRDLRDELGLEELSMGMSNDFQIAIEEGATMIRIGSKIFGQRI